MSFFLVFMTFWILYQYDYLIFSEKRTAKIKEKILNFKNNGLVMYISKDRYKEKYTYDDKSMVLEISKKSNKIEIKVFFKSLFDERKMILNMVYDINQDEWIKNIEHERNIKDYWGIDQEKTQMINELKNILIEKSNELFNLHIDNIFKTNEISAARKNNSAETKNIISDNVPLFELEQLLSQGKFDWKTVGEKEVYTTTEQNFSITIEKEKDSDFQTITINQINEKHIATIIYNPEGKEIRELDINKGIMQKLKDIPSFVNILQNILFFCYEQSTRQKNKVNAIIENFNNKPYNFIEKVKETNDYIQMIEADIELLEAEDKHLFITIKDKRLPEIMQLQKKLSFDSSSENELTEMLDILLNLLKNIKTKIDEKNNKTLLIKEKLIEQLKNDNE